MPEAARTRPSPPLPEQPSPPDHGETSGVGPGREALVSGGGTGP